MPAQDLSALNGVTFTRQEVGPASNHGAGTTYSGGVFQLSGAYYEAGRTTFTVSVLNSAYTAASSGDVASFGEIKVERTLGASTTNAYYLVVGFSNDGFLVGPGASTPGGVLGVSAAAPTVTAFSTVSTADSNFPLTFGQTNDFVAPCFAEGTRILTARGEVAVEDMVEGDEVMTVSGELRPAIWIGSRRVRPQRHPQPRDLNPIRVRRGAFGEGRPERDLRLSPGHAVFVDGVLTPMGGLVNGATIVQEAVEQVRYFHVELDAHDVLLAEGLACESYLDDGNREAFANAAEHAALYGRLDPVDWDGACAPVVRDGAELTAIRTVLHARAEAMGWAKSLDHGLTLVADGVEIAPAHVAGERLWFAVPACQALVLRSACAIPAETEAAHGDTRRLGVALAELKLDGVALDLAAQAFGAGFHGLERHGEQAWRWTDGAAALDCALQRPAMVEIVLRNAIPTWVRPAASRLHLVKAG